MRANHRSLPLSNACLIFFAVSPAALAQPSPTGAAIAQPSLTGVRAEATRLIEDAETKLTKLAEAIPPAKFTYRPTKDVRSVSEVFLHVAAANFSIPRRLGTEPPTDFKGEGFEKSTSEKTKVMEALKNSFAHAKQAAAKLTEADMEKTADWRGGQKATYREILFFMAAHDHEHLGQTITYARMLGITPSWTEEQQKKQKAQAQQPKT